MSSVENVEVDIIGLPDPRDLSVEVWPIEKLTPHPRNYRGHPQKQIDQLANSLKSRGFRKAIVVQKSTGMVIAGHGLLLAAKSIGLSEVPVAPWDCTDSQAVSLLAADNELSRLAVDDDEMLNRILFDLSEEYGDPAMLIDEGIGFEIDELLERMDQVEKQDLLDGDILDPEVPETPKNPVTKPGDIWTLGRHRLLCGDSTIGGDVDRLMGGEKADMMVTDPPYNVDYAGGTKDALKIANDSMGDSAFRSFLVSSMSNAFQSIKPGAAFYIWHSDTEGFNFRGAIMDIGESVRQCLIWEKNSLVMGRQDYHWQHEPCLYGWKNGAAHSFYGGRNKTTILKFQRPTRSAEHPTMKPVALFLFQIGNSSKKGDIILDPFMGSGTTIIASEQLDRRGFGLELSPGYCDVIVERWEGISGKKAKKESR